MTLSIKVREKLSPVKPVIGILIRLAMDFQKSRFSSQCPTAHFKTRPRAKTEKLTTEQILHKYASQNRLS